LPQGKAIDPRFVAEIEGIWLAAKSIGKNVSARAVWDRFVRLHSNDRKLVGLRKVQGIISEAMTRSEGIKRFEFKFWKPWGATDRDFDTDPTGEEFDHLLQMNEVCKLFQNRPLLVHEAKWALRLRVALDGLSMKKRYVLVDRYARREVVIHTFGDKARGYNDLDSFVAYKPWVEGHEYSYQQAASSGAVTMYRIPSHGYWFGEADWDEREKELFDVLDCVVAEGASSWEAHSRLMDLVKPSKLAAYNDTEEMSKRWMDSVADFWDGKQVRATSEAVSDAPFVDFAPATSNTPFADYLEYTVGQEGTE